MKDRVLFFVFVSVMFPLFGCGADEEETVDKVSDKALITVGEKKHQITDAPVAAAPEMPSNSSIPSVIEVGFYRDGRLTKPFTGKVRPKQKFIRKSCSLKI